MHVYTHCSLHVHVLYMYIHLPLYTHIVHYMYMYYTCTYTFHCIHTLFITCTYTFHCTLCRSLKLVKVGIVNLQVTATVPYQLLPIIPTTTSLPHYSSTLQQHRLNATCIYQLVYLAASCTDTCYIHVTQNTVYYTEVLCCSK